MKSELSEIAWMNKTFKLPCNDKPTDQGAVRLNQFIEVFKDEVKELDEVYDEAGKPDFVALADCFGDLLVYLLSECKRWGIPIDEVFDIIMESQESKLVDGKPVMAEDGSKFIKGPNYEPPEKYIAALLEKYRRSDEPNECKFCGGAATRKEMFDRFDREVWVCNACGA